MAGKFLSFVKHWSKEIIIALVLAIVAYFICDAYLKGAKQQIVQDNLKAVITVVAEDKSGKPIGQGSGFFINPNGELVTNYHVIKGASNIVATFPTGAIYMLDKIIYQDASADIAVLQFVAKNTPYVNLGNSDGVKPYQDIYAIGTPDGLQNTISSGVISNPDVDGYIQFTAPISPGSSGGGLFDENGDVIGVTAENQQISSGPQKGEDQNLNFAVPINNVKTVLAGNTNITSGSPELYYSQGVLADNNQQWDIAITDYNQAIQIDDKYSDAYMGLGWDYFYKGNYNLELKNFLAATQLAPNNSDDLYYLAGSYEDVGQYSDAINTYTKVLKLKPDYTAALHDLALAYLAVGDKNSATQLVPVLTKLDKGWGNELNIIINNTK
ncbi:MAG: trypsin-like peptidase domain-containing protein [Candidatus Staskawiczbacteria bacterium]|jgi:tetratricopeptide (TPR) repeat protein